MKLPFPGAIVARSDIVAEGSHFRRGRCRAGDVPDSRPDGRQMTLRQVNLRPAYSDCGELVSLSFDPRIYRVWKLVASRACTWPAVISWSRRSIPLRRSPSRRSTFLWIGAGIVRGSAGNLVMVAVDLFLYVLYRNNTERTTTPVAASDRAA